MDASKALEWVIGRRGFVDRRAARREADGLTADRERQELAVLDYLTGYVGSREPEAMAVATATVAQQQRGRPSTRSPETLIEALCRILECKPGDAIRIVEELAAARRASAPVKMDITIQAGTFAGGDDAAADLCAQVTREVRRGVVP